MNIKATPIKACHLEPGDLFSTAGPEYWSKIDEKQSIGERVFIRTNTPAAVAPDADMVVYKIEVITLPKGVANAN